MFDVDRARERCFVKGGPDEARAREQAAEDRDGLMAYVGELETDIAALEKERDDLMQHISDAVQTLDHVLNRANGEGPTERWLKARAPLRKLRKTLDGV